MNIFSYGMLKKIDINSEDNKATILKKVRLLMVKRLFPIQKLALLQKLLVENEGHRALCLFHYLPDKYIKKTLPKKKVEGLVENVIFSGKEWEL